MPQNFAFHIQICYLGGFQTVKFEEGLLEERVRGPLCRYAVVMEAGGGKLITAAETFQNCLL